MTPERLRIDFLFLDLETCTRCRGTDENLASALEAARELLALGGTEVELNEIHVETSDQARELRLASSPTIRINGRDIALELRESPCGTEACTDGGGDAIDCRVWVHAGREYTEPPVALILDAILAEVDGRAEVSGPDSGAYELPENLERFFAGNAGAAPGGAPACCPPPEQRSCCDPEEKAECCGAATGGSCGCR